MVSTKIFAATDAKVKTDSNYATGRSAKSGDDFTKTLDSTMKNSDSKYAKADNNVRAIDKSDKPSVSKDQLKKLFKQNDTSKTEDSFSDSNAEMQALNQITVLNSQITGELSQQFDVTEEEVVQIMDNLSLDAYDMLDMRNVVEVITELSDGTDMAELITDDSVASLLRDMKQETETVGEVVEKLGMTREAYDEAVKLNSSDMLRLEPEPVYDTEEDIATDTVTNIAVREADNTNPLSNSGNMNGEMSENDAGTEQMNDKLSDADTKAHTHNADVLQSAVSMTDVISNIEEFIGESDSVRESGLSENIFRQILDGISANAGPDTTSLELQLNPESLGKVHITVSSRAGVLTAQIAAQNQIAKEAIESQINVLRESFENQGLKVEEVEITLASRGFEQNLDRENQGEERNQSRRARHISQSELDEINGVISNQDELIEEVHKEQGNTVSYTA